MEKKQLGNTNLMVTKICLGSMTWGEQNTEAEGFEQLDYALDEGINFIDTAEMYAVPPKPETSGHTETIIGNWFKKSGKRNDVILASKMAGPGVPWLREGRGLDPADIEAAVDASLKRLQTDVIDLYQIHWTQRDAARWGKQNYHESMYGPADKEDLAKFYQALAKVQKSGKIRHLGLSNETAWGVMEHQRLSAECQLPQMVSVQNAYSLVRREFEVSLAEVAMQEKVGLLAYSPLAGGLLSGKYRGGERPEKARFTLYPDLMGYYDNDRTHESLKRYQALADDLGISLTQLSLAFVNDRAFVTSNIIGATTMAQLKEDISSAEITLSPETYETIDKIFTEFPNPGNW